MSRANSYEVAGEEKGTDSETDEVPAVHVIVKEPALKPVDESTMLAIVPTTVPVQLSCSVAVNELGLT